MPSAPHRRCGLVLLPRNLGHAAWPSYGSCVGSLNPKLAPSDSESVLFELTPCVQVMLHTQSPMSISLTQTMARRGETVRRREQCVCVGHRHFQKEEGKCNGEMEWGIKGRTMEGCCCR
eukprot:3861605-Rhodomonas_salina.1